MTHNGLVLVISDTTLAKIPGKYKLNLLITEQYTLNRGTILSQFDFLEDPIIRHPFLAK